MTRLRPQSPTRVPSTHGGGAVYQIAFFPLTVQTTDFDWRISVAEIDGPGPFSDFPGIDRILIPVDGGPLTLTIDGTARRAEQFSGIAFPGDVQTICTPSSTRARVLNIMTRRGVFSARADIIEPDSPVTISPDARAPVFVAVLDGTWRTDPSGAPIGPVDVIRIEQPVTLAGTGHLARIVFEACD